MAVVEEPAAIETTGTEHVYEIPFGESPEDRDQRIAADTAAAEAAKKAEAAVEEAAQQAKAAAEEFARQSKEAASEACKEYGKAMTDLEAAHKLSEDAFLKEREAAEKVMARR